MSLAGGQIIPINVNFHLQKCLEIFDKNSADKIWFEKDKEWKVPSLMPIRVNNTSWHLNSKIPEILYLNIFLSKQQINGNWKNQRPAEDLKPMPISVDSLYKLSYLWTRGCFRCLLFFPIRLEILLYDLMISVCELFMIAKSF